MRTEHKVGRQFQLSARHLIERLPRDSQTNRGAGKNLQACPACGTLVRDARRHQARHHPELVVSRRGKRLGLDYEKIGGVYRCLSCGKEFGRLSGAYMHAMGVHRKPLKCEYCEAGYGSELRRRRHVDKVHAEKLVK